MKYMILRFLALLALLAGVPALAQPYFSITSSLSCMASLDPVVIDYRRAIEANGGSINTATLAAVNQFVRGCRADGTWDSLLEIGLFAGVDNLAAALVKIKTPSGVQRVITNVNYVAGDYTATGASAGLAGNGTTKYGRTGFAQNQLTAANRSLGFYSTVRATAGGISGGVFSTQIGSDSTGGTNGFGHLTGGGVTIQEFFGASTATPVSLTGISPSHFIGQSNGASTSIAIFRNGGSKTTRAVTAATPSANELYIHALNRDGSPTLYGNERITFYHIGTQLSDVQVATFSARVNTLMTAFGANKY